MSAREREDEEFKCFIYSPSVHERERESLRECGSPSTFDPFSRVADTTRVCGGRRDRNGQFFGSHLYVRTLESECTVEREIAFGLKCCAVGLKREAGGNRIKDTLLSFLLRMKANIRQMPLIFFMVVSRATNCNTSARAFEASNVENI